MRQIDDEIQTTCYILSSIIIEALLSGNPELEVILKNRNNVTIENESISPHVKTHNLTTQSKEFSLHPPLDPFILYSYTIPSFDASPVIPISGSYHLKQITANQVKILLQLKIQPVSSCSISIPFPNRYSISSTEVTATTGKISTNPEKNSILWKIGKLK